MTDPAPVGVNKYENRSRVEARAGMIVIYQRSACANRRRVVLASYATALPNISPAIPRDARTDRAHGASLRMGSAVDRYGALIREGGIMRMPSTCILRFG